MDADLYFHKKVLEKYGVDKMLTPVNLGNGALENVSLSDLRKELDLCYINIDNSITLKEKLLDYLEDYLVDIGALYIPTQKRILKKIQRKIKTLEKKHPNLDYNNKNDEVIIDEISNLTWKLKQEKYIFHYLKELPFFIRIWTTEKRKEYNDAYLKNYINREDNKSTLKNFLKKRKQNKIIRKYKWHILIEPLVSGKISNIQKESNQELTKTELSARIVEDLKLNIRIKDIAPYIQYSFIDNQNYPKNLFSRKKVETIYKYCKENSIEIIDDIFLSKVKEYINL